MRTHKAIKSSIVSTITHCIGLILVFINRRIFVQFLEIEYLGYESLFSSVFSVLSLAELGVGSIISFHLYRSLALGDDNETGKLMYIYKWLYRIIAAVIIVVGLASMVFLPYVIKGQTKSWSYLYLIYFLQLAGMASSYLFSYRRTLYIANQKEYVCALVDMFAKIGIQITRFIVLVFSKSFVLYLLVQTLGNIIANAVIAFKARKDYPQVLMRFRITKADIKTYNLKSELKNFLAHKLAYAVFGSTDNIVISAFCGVKMVAIYGNYYLLNKGLCDLVVTRLMGPLQSAIGNLVYSKESNEKHKNLFEVLTTASFFLANYIGFGYFLFLQPAIKVWMGNEYLLSEWFVLLFSITIFCSLNFEIIYQYRCAFGDYQDDRNFMIATALINILLSIGLVQKWGINGVQMGTLAACCCLYYGRIKFVFKHYLKETIKPYIWKQVGLLLTFLAECLVGRVVYQMDLTIKSIICGGLIWITIPGIVGVLLFRKTKGFRLMVGYIRFLGKGLYKKLKGETDL